jgi:hypothetical protein
MLTDDFDDGVEALAWSRSWAGEGCAKTESAGTATFAPSQKVCGYRSASSYDLTGGAMVVEVVEMVDPATTAFAFFQALIDEDNLMGIVQTGGSLRAVLTVAGVETAEEVPYGQSAHRFWRIRETGGTIRWETSATGFPPWPAVRSAASPFATATTAIDVVLGAGWNVVDAGVGDPDAGVGAAGQARFDNFNP